MCPTRDNCTALCDEAEAWANQDYVGQREKTIGITQAKENSVEMWSNVFLTKTEREIVTLLGRGLNRRDVCQILNMTRDCLRNHIKRMRKKCYGFYP